MVPERSTPKGPSVGESMGDGGLVLLWPKTRGCSATNFPLAAACASSARVDQRAAGEPRNMRLN